MTDYNQDDELLEIDSFETQIAEMAARSSHENKDNSHNQFLDPPINPHPRSDAE